MNELILVISLLVVIVLMTAIIVFILVFQRKERKDLYDRIMSNSLKEYRKSPESAPTAHEKAIMKWRHIDGGDGD
ncbi:MAG: hypothetical protein J6N52_03695 [Clostridia bacterium]|nr:hypothetical protein [Clostridia bacterium]